MDFLGSQNFELLAGGLQTTAAVKPYEKREVARLVTKDPTLPWTLKAKYR